MSRYCHSNPVCLFRSCTAQSALLIERRPTPILSERRGGMYKNGTWDTKPAIGLSLKRSSLEPNLLQSVYRNSCTAYRLVTNLATSVNFNLLFRGAKFSTTDISHSFCRTATKFGSVRGLANRSLFPEFRDLWSAGPVIPCGDMHQSFTDALVRWFCDNFLMIADRFSVLSIRYVASFLYKCPASRGGSLRLQHGPLVSIVSSN